MENKLCVVECAAVSVTPSGVYSNRRAVRGLFGLFTWAKISADGQAGPGAHPASDTLDTRAFPGL